MKRFHVLLCLFAIILGANASTIDSQKALSLVKELRGDAANKNVDFYIGTVRTCFNEWYCPVVSLLANGQIIDSKQIIKQ